MHKESSPPASERQSPAAEDSRALRAVALASALLQDARDEETPGESRQSERIARMVQDPAGKAFTIGVADEVLRLTRPAQAAQRLRTLLARYGLPGFCGMWDRWLLRVARMASFCFPRLVMRGVKRQVRAESLPVILSAEERDLARYLERRQGSDGARVNLNLLGEAVLGEAEARNRLDSNLAYLADPQIHYISVKISSIDSQISLPAYGATLEVVQDRLRLLYRAALAHGGARPKFVNLDMEEYRDLHLTVDAFRTVLDEEEFSRLEAGIVLQAYLPDSYQIQKDLTRWALARHGRTGTGIKVRLVKGANLAMERVEASLAGWPQAPYGTKEAVDANFKRMLHFGCQAANAVAVKIGVASHNLFDIAYALLLREENGVTARVEFEMLEGMANAQARAVRESSGGMLYYAPVVRPAHFESAIAYLVRRLDENTAPQNFLSHLFDLEEGSPAWTEQRDRFLAACEAAHSGALPDTPRRTQNRLTERREPSFAGTAFSNAPDTDFSLPQNRQWAAQIVERCVAQPHLSEIGYVQDGGVIEAAVDTARRGQARWEERGIAGRAAVLRAAAAVIASNRGEIIAALMREAHKALLEADTEVSEAVDFANYYARAYDGPGWLDGSHAQALGVVVVTAPWNFPYAIPAGGCLAALMAGNAVILKPAPETRALAQLLTEHLWSAGVPRDVLHCLPLPDNSLGEKLITHEKVAAVILTGSLTTAQLFQEWKPDLRLHAETSGKNSLVITAAADLDLAVKDLVRGAFGHAGQKCSATSLALVESDVYDSVAFRRQLLDAAASLAVGPATDPASVVTPLIQTPGPDLLRALTSLDAGESWLLQPQPCDDAGRLWTPGIKLGVAAGSWFHRTECFGPVLGLIRTRDLDDAIRIQNDTAFGLTGGIHSLDDREIARWCNAVEVGNAYVNRATTGAIVRRQPFGGWKDSVVGPGAKAGGPNYVASFSHWDQGRLPQTRDLRADPATEGDLFALAARLGHRDTLEASLGSYRYWWLNEFSREHDPSNLLGESNAFRYRPRPSLIVRVGCEAEPIAVLQAILACRICGVPHALSVSEPRDLEFLAALDRCRDMRQESDAELAARILAEGRRETLRQIGLASPDFRQALCGNNATVIEHPVVANGRLELRHYLREQTVSRTTHRYGNVPINPERAGDTP